MRDLGNISIERLKGLGRHERLLVVGLLCGVISRCQLMITAPSDESLVRVATIEDEFSFWARHDRLQSSIADFRVSKNHLYSTQLQLILRMASNLIELEYVTLDVFTNTKYEVRGAGSFSSLSELCSRSFGWRC